MKRFFLALGLVTAVAAAPAAQRDHSGVTLPLHLTAGLISAGGIGNPTGTARIEINVKRWSLTSERTTLVNAVAKSQDKLLEELKDQKSVGTVRFNTELAWDLRYARQIPGEDGGTRVFLATDRPMSVLEIWRDPRYSQYPFTLIDLQFDPDGGATGSIMLAARVTADKDGRFIQVENFATQPIPLSDIHMDRE
ncbi:MAG TPA: hypothetical protein VL173_00575 [Vicinamibacterales bacterium]|jgi:hypothetical protein|nr:hypothetical protein [Vicinamibacterales bacterium]